MLGDVIKELKNDVRRKLVEVQAGREPRFNNWAGGEIGSTGLCMGHMKVNVLKQYVGLI